MDRRAWDLPPGEDRRAELEEERAAPEHVVPWSGKRQRDQPDDVRRAERQQEGSRERTRLGHVAACALVQHEQHRTHADVGERKPDRHTSEDAWNGRCEHGNAEHPEQGEQPVGKVVRVEAVGVERVARPRPPDRHEEAEELEEAHRRGLGAQGAGELADRGDEYEVEEELQPRRPAVVLLAAGQRPQARRLEEPRARAHLPAAKVGLALLDERREALVRVF